MDVDLDQLENRFHSTPLILKMKYDDVSVQSTYFSMGFSIYGFSVREISQEKCTKFREIQP